MAPPHTPGQSIRAMKQAVRDMQSKLSTPRAEGPSGTVKGAPSSLSSASSARNSPGASVHEGAHADRSRSSDSDAPETEEGDAARPHAAVGELIDEAARAYAYKVLPMVHHHNSPVATPTRGRPSHSQDARLSQREARIRASIRADEDEDEDDPTTPPKGTHLIISAELEPAQAEPPQDSQRPAEEYRKQARQFLREARATLEGAQEIARMVSDLVHESAIWIREWKAAADAHSRNIEREARAVLETARRKRREEDTEQKGKLDDLFLRTRAAAATLKEQADTEIQEQYATRKRLMKETNLALAKGQADLEAIVRQSEDTVQKAEEELNAVKSQAQREISRATDFKRDVQAMIEEAQSASSKAWLEVAHIRSGLRAQCCEQVDSLLQTVAAAQATLQDMCTEQQHLTRTLSRGLKLEAKCAMRHAVQMKELRKHLTRWSAGHEIAKFRNNSLQRIIRLPNLSVRADSFEEVERKHTFQIIDQMQI